jgi:hypothetical protein
VFLAFLGLFEREKSGEFEHLKMNLLGFCLHEFLCA